MKVAISICSGVHDYSDFDSLTTEFQDADPNFLSFLKAMLAAKGSERKSAKELLGHDFIRDGVRTIDLRKHEHQITQMQQEMTDLKLKHEKQVLRLEMERKIEIDQLKSDFEAKFSQMMSQFQDFTSRQMEQKQNENDLKLKKSAEEIKRLNEKVAELQKFQSAMEPAIKRQADTVNQLQLTQAKTDEQLRENQEQLKQLQEKTSVTYMRDELNKLQEKSKLNCMFFFKKKIFCMISST